MPPRRLDRIGKPADAGTLGIRLRRLHERECVPGAISPIVSTTRSRVSFRLTRALGFATTASVPPPNIGWRGQSLVQLRRVRRGRCRVGPQVPPLERRPDLLPSLVGEARRRVAPRAARRHPRRRAAGRSRDRLARTSPIAGGYRPSRRRPGSRRSWKGWPSADGSRGARARPDPRVCGRRADAVHEGLASGCRTGRRDASDRSTDTS